jgi:hypothetical protein
MVELSQMKVVSCRKKQHIVRQSVNGVAEVKKILRNMFTFNLRESALSKPTHWFPLTA